MSIRSASMILQAALAAFLILLATPSPAAAEESAAKYPASASSQFDPASVPVTTATLPPFPFFKTLEGLNSIFDEKDKNVRFNAQYFIAGNEPVKVEGKIFHDAFPLAADHPYTELEFHKNYENAIKELGGVKISAAQWTPENLAKAGGEETVLKYSYSAAPAPDYLHETYLIRSSDKEYWIEISTGAIPLHGYVVVLEKQAMKQSLKFLDAAAMKKAIDETGRVALHINFDVDKATLRPDAQPVMDEINKLLSGDPSLKLSIEGHTDSTGSAEHNRQLSTARARSVMGALIGLGIDPSRLKSSGFGPDKPVADNATEDGRAKNRRVELVKY